MKTLSARSISARSILGVAIAASMGIGYAIGAQPHMVESIAMLQSAQRLGDLDQQ